MTESLPQDVKLLQQLLVEQHKQNRYLLEKIIILMAQVEKLQRLLFGQKSERHIAKSLPTHGIESQASPEVIQISNAPRQQNLNGRRQLPQDLLRIKIKHEIAEEKRYCPICQGKLHHIGEQATEQLDFMSVKLYVKEHLRAKYACRHCQGKVLLAPLPAKPIDKGLAGSGLLAEILVNK